MAKYNFQIGTSFIFDDDVMRYMGIKPVEIIDSHKEVWRYAILNKNADLQIQQRYLISTYGRIYDLDERKLVTPKSRIKSSNGYYYQEVKLVNDYGSSPYYFVHRLVALAFIPEVEDKPFVNHIDACPEHNWVWNLEWCNASENYWHAHRMGLINPARGEERPNALWSDDEIRLFCSLMEEGHKATYIFKILGDILKDEKVTYERVRTLYKHIVRKTHWTHISKDYDIDFTPFNYRKEKASIKAYKERHKEIFK